MKVKLGKRLKVDVKLLLLVVAIIVVIAYFGIFKNNSPDGVSLDKVKCIASKSTVYISTGCHACASQEAMFGDNFWQLNYVDCMVDGDKCGEKNITRVPTWIINDHSYVGVQEIEKLINLTGC